MTLNFHVDDSAKGRYYMILCRDLLTALVTNLKSIDHVIEGDYGPFKGSMAPMVYMGKYECEYLNAVKLHQKNLLLMLMQKKCMNRDKSVLLLN